MNERLLNNLKHYCSAGDFTNQKQFQDYLSYYTERITSIREKCDQIDSFLSRNMVTEAALLYQQQHPSLREQINELRFPGVQDWLDTADIYGFAIPSSIDDSVLTRLTEAVASQKGVQTLLAEFRQIASGNDLHRKTELARQILAKQPGDAQWGKTLHDLEEKSKVAVMNQAKEAILQHDEDRLQELYDYLSNEPWNTPPRPEVMAKIQRSLHEWRLEALGRQADAVAEEVDRLYCEDFAGNLELLSRLFQRWDAICAEESDFQPSATSKAHVDEVRGMWERKKVELQHEMEQRNEFEQRRAQLKAVMDNGGTCEELEAAYHALQSVGLAVPPEDDQRYQACHERARLLVVRRQRMTFLGALVAVVVIGGLAVLGWAKYRESRLCKEYLTRMEAVLMDSRRAATECDAILAEMEQEHPELLQKSSVGKMRKRVAERQEEQRENRVQAENRIAHIEDLLKDFKLNHRAIRNNLAVLKKMTLTADLLETIAKLEETVESRQKSFAEERKQEYRRLNLDANANLRKLENANKEASDKDILRFSGTLREILRSLEEVEADLEEPELEECKKLRAKIQERLALN